MPKKSTYINWIAELKKNIQQSKMQTQLQINRNMLLTYWYIGKEILEKQETEGWGAGIIEQLSIDLSKAFPDEVGFSVRSLNYMRKFALSFSTLLVEQNTISQQAVAKLKNSKNAISQQAAAKSKNSKNAISQQAVAKLKNSKNAISQQAVANLKNTEIISEQQTIAQFGAKKYILSNPLLVSIPWGHHTYLLDKIIDESERIWYIEKTIENTWSRAVLKYQVDTDLYQRQVKKTKTSNFHLTLPKQQSDLANQILKDPYIFSFLPVGEKLKELDLEKKLISHIQDFLVELGAGFAFVGRQLKFRIGNKQQSADLLFYHLFLRSFIAIDLKMEDFEASHVGQLNSYLNYVNQKFKHEDDNPSIGIILCGSKDDVFVDFALQNINHPIGVSEYKYVKQLPKKLQGKIPNAKQLQDVVKKFLRKNK